VTQLDICLNPSVAPADEARLSRQCMKLLRLLAQRPHTNVELMKVHDIFNLSARTDECRKAGFDIPAPTRISGGLFMYAARLTGEQLSLLTRAA
jgi:hypothetical protein